MRFRRAGWTDRSIGIDGNWEMNTVFRTSLRYENASFVISLFDMMADDWEEGETIAIVPDVRIAIFEGPKGSMNSFGPAERIAVSVSERAVIEPEKIIFPLAEPAPDRNSGEIRSLQLNRTHKKKKGKR